MNKTIKCKNCGKVLGENDSWAYHGGDNYSCIVCSNPTCVLCNRLSKEDVLKAIIDEPELPGDMPDEMWEAIRNDRDAMTELLRITVRQTKQGIFERLK